MRLLGVVLCAAIGAANSARSADAPHPADSEGMSLTCQVSHFGALYRSGEEPSFDLKLTGSPAATNDGTAFVCTVFDWKDQLVLSRTLPAVTAGAQGARPCQTARLSLAPGELGGRVGAFRLVVSCGGATNETGFAFLTGPNPRPCQWVGTGIHGTHGWARGDFRFLDILSAAGIGIVRAGVGGWASIEQKKGVYNVQPNFDKFVDGLVSHGIGLNAILSFSNPIYENPYDPDAFARWSAFMARRYGTRVKTWEIWNEPQHFGFRKRYGPSNDVWVAKFVELTRKADDAIRAVQPNANVAVTSEDEWWLIEKMLYGGIARPHNLVSFHPYCHWQPRPENATFFKDGGKKMRATAAAAPGGVKRFIVTESGWTTYSGKMKYLEIAGGYPRVSLVQQAQYIVRMLILARQMGAEYACQYDFMNDGKERNYTEHNFGLVREDYSPKPSFSAVAQLTRLVGDATPMGDLSDDPKRYRFYRFRTTRGDVFAAWAVEGTTEIALPPEVKGSPECLDLMGNRIDMPLRADRLILDETPVYIVMDADDDTSMLQSLLDKGGNISLPARTYRISRKLLFRSSTSLKFAEGSRIVLLPHSDSMLAGNADPQGGNRDITIEGGIWDMDNLNQAPNPYWQHFCRPPLPRIERPTSYDPNFYRGVAIYFENVSNLVVKGITIRNPVTYALQLCKVSHFKVEDISFDFTTDNPIKGNMDGVHLDGGCHHGRIANVRGTCWDDMVAINANDGSCAACQSAITDIEIDGVETDYSHSAVRLLSAPDPVERIRIRNVRGHFFKYAIGLTHYFPGRPKGSFKDISLENICVGHAPQPPDMWPMGRSPILFFDKEVVIDGLKLDGFETLNPLAEVPERWKLKPGVVPHATPR